MKRTIADHRPATDWQEYDIALRLVAHVPGDDLAHFNRLRSALIEWIVDHAESGEIVMMTAGPLREDR